MLLSHLLERAARLFPDVEAVRDEVHALSFDELARRVGQWTHELAELGVGRGDRVVILARNRVEFVEVYFALFAIGAVAVPVNWRLQKREVEYIVADAEAKAVFADAAFVALLPELGDRPRVCFDTVAPEGWRAYAESGQKPPSGSAEATLTPGDVAVQMYTSGTTGLPKGSMLSHHNVYSLLNAWLLDMRLEPRTDRFLQVTPLFHVGALLMMVSTVASGVTLRLMPEFVAPRALEILRDERISQALFVPAMVQWLLAERGIEDGGFEALQMIIYGAAPMPVAVLEQAIGVFGCEFLQGYGLTETAGVLTTLRPVDHRYEAGSEPPRKLASIGRGVLCCEVRVVDEVGGEVKPGEVGEIVARGDNVHVGYWNRPEEDEESFASGWFHTGDLATVDEEGYLYVVDRKKDMICVAGENVYPREIELVLAEHEGVADVAVIGAPHRHWGEEVVALVVRETGSEVSDRELIQYSRVHLARFKCPTRVEWREEIPRNAAGKVLKRELRDPYWEGRERRV